MTVSKQTPEYHKHSTAYFCNAAEVVCETAGNSDSVTESVDSGCESAESVLFTGPILGTKMWGLSSVVKQRR